MSQPARRSAPLGWLIVSAGAALTATLIDAVLLERKHGYFTGGFLSVDHATSVGDVIGFLAGSILADIAVIGPLVAAALLAAGWLRLYSAARVALALALALVPLMVADFIAYSLFDYLGEAFDLSLMFDLTNRSPREILAVAGSHLLMPAAALGIGAVAIGATIWALHRFAAASPSTRIPRIDRPGRLVVGAAAALVAGLAGSTVLRLQGGVFDYGLRRKPSAEALGWIVSLATDVDRDGYGLLSVPADPDPWDPRVVPYGFDVPGDGIDEDGVGGDLPIGAPYTEPDAGPGVWPSRPTVVLIVLESFRADALGAIVNGIHVTPVLEALAARGVSSRFAYSHNAYTVQSRHHLFAGSLANVRGGTTLIDDFKANGYQVAYFSAQDESFGAGELGVGFSRADVAYDARVDRTLRYSSFTTPGSLAVPFTVVERRIGEFFAHRTSTAPLFLYVNFHDTHFPYRHAAMEPLLTAVVLRQADIAPARAAELRAMYLNTAANVDRAIGRVLETVRRSVGPDPGIIVTADHGESLFDEGFLGHGYALNDVQTRVPLVAVNLPMIIPEPFGQSDLRDAVRAAMRSGPAPAALRARTGRGVFQYLGTIERPRQVALRTTTGQTVFDFRTATASVRPGAWQRLEDLGPQDSRDVLEVVHVWERMRLAQQSAAHTH